jgi:hypothetical protein
MLVLVMETISEGSHVKSYFSSYQPLRVCFHSAMSRSLCPTHDHRGAFVPRLRGKQCDSFAVVDTHVAPVCPSLSSSILDQEYHDLGDATPMSPRTEGRHLLVVIGWVCVSWLQKLSGCIRRYVYVCTDAFLCGSEEIQKGGKGQNITGMRGNAPLWHG